MSSLTVSEEIATLEAAIGVIVNQKQALADAVQALTPLSNANLELRDIIRAMEADDDKVDAVMVRLRDLLPQAPAPETPVTEPTSETPVTDLVTGGSGEGVDPVDPPAAPATEPAAPSDLDGPTA